MAIGRQPGRLLARLKQMDPYLRTIYILNAISLVGGILYGMYYGVFLYRHTFSLSVLALDGLFGGVGGWLGYLSGVTLIRRCGYAACFRTAFLLWAAVAFGTALMANHIAAWFILLAVLKAIPSGMYTANCDTIMLREVPTARRNRFLQFKLGFEFLVNVVLPSAVGALIGLRHGYQLAFLVAGVLYLGALAVPLELRRPDIGVNLHDILGLFRRPLYVPHAANRMAASGFNQLNAFVLTIIPFLLLKNELRMGLLTSATALMAGGVSFYMQKVKPARSVRLGYGAYALRALISAAFVYCWAAPVLMLWQLISKLVTPLHDPLQQGLDIQNDSLILGEEMRSKALHINVLNNTLLLLGSTLAYGAFYVITKQAPGQQRTVLQVLILSYAAWRFVNLTISARINARLLAPVGVVRPRLDERTSGWYVLQLVVVSRLNRIRAGLWSYV